MTVVDACLQYKDTCALLHEHLGKLKGGGPNTELIEDCMFLFSQLKKFNCKSQSQCKRVRDNTHQLKKKLDSTDLILKNLQFEEIYLQREIQQCHNFKSVDEELSLIPEKEYLASVMTAPDEKADEEKIEKKEGEKKENKEGEKKENKEEEKIPEEAHERMVHRLKWELQQRKAMQVELENWQKKKVELEQELGSMKEYLASLPPQLEELLNCTGQVQECLGLKLVHRKNQTEMAAWLPPQLYNIYSQVTGYSEYKKSGTVVTINGDLERAKNLTLDTSDIEEIIPEPEVRQSKRRSAVHEPGKKKLFKTHPLTVEVIVPCDNGVHAKVLFTYLVKLRVVTVGISLMITTASPWRDKFSVGTDYMSSKELLCALWEGDHGDECPNPEMPALLNKYSLPSKSKIPNSTGRPFLWAQRLAGITSWGSSAGLDISVSKATVPPFLDAIKQRCLARLALKYQLRNLSSTKTVKEGAISQPTLLTELASWKEVQYDSLASSYPARTLKHISDKDSLYEVVVKRGKTSCKSLIALSLEYPVIPPFVLLEITSPGGKANSSNDKNIRAIEEELNVHIEELYTGELEYVLTKVVCKLCLCIDVYVEGCGLEPQIKFFINKFKGPDNILPYVYNSEKQYFQHR